MQSNVPLLVANGVSRRGATGDTWLLRDVCIEIPTGSRVMVVGAAGSGKTLLLRALARLDGVDTGQILWKGEPIYGSAVPRFRKHAMYFHQRPAIFEGTVEENLRLPFHLRSHRNREFLRDEALSLLERVHRDASFFSRSSRDLSGGEGQIVALLRGIQLQPTLLLLDEPTASLDDVSTRLIETLIIDWLSQSPDERAFVWVSHDQAQVERMGDRVVRMADGRIRSDASDGVKKT